MNSTIEILERISENSRKHPDEVFTRVYRYLLREDIYFAAYKKLYANNGASTTGTDKDTADGFSVEYIHNLIEKLKSGEYQPKPSRRIYIPKANGTAIATQRSGYFTSAIEVHPTVDLDGGNALAVTHSEYRTYVPLSR